VLPVAATIAPAPTLAPQFAPEPHPTRVPAPTHTPAPVHTPAPEPRAEPVKHEPAPLPHETPAEEPRHHREEPPPAVPEQAYDQELQTTLAIKFDVKPVSTVISFKSEDDRRFTVIGRAEDHDANERKSPAFDLPGPGIYYLRLNFDGRIVTYRLVASAGSAPTVIHGQGGKG
jgi:hypothetical protein